MCFLICLNYNVYTYYCQEVFRPISPCRKISLSIPRARCYTAHDCCNCSPTMPGTQGRVPPPCYHYRSRAVHLLLPLYVSMLPQDEALLLFIPVSKPHQRIQIFVGFWIIRTTFLPATISHLAPEIVFPAFSHTRPYTIPCQQVWLQMCLPFLAHLLTQSVVIDLWMFLFHRGNINVEILIAAMTTDYLPTTERTALHIASWCVVLSNLHSAIRALLYYFQCFHIILSRTSITAVNSSVPCRSLSTNRPCESMSATRANGLHLA